MKRFARLALAAAVLVVPTIAQARIVRIEITKIEPAFAGRSFGSVGTFERLTGTGFWECRFKRFEAT